MDALQYLALFCVSDGQVCSFRRHSGCRRRAMDALRGAGSSFPFVRSLGTPPFQLGTPLADEPDPMAAERESKSKLDPGISELCLEDLERASRAANGNPALPLRDWIALAESWRIAQALREARGNRSAAARALGIGRRTLYSKMEKLGLVPSWGVVREGRPPQDNPSASVRGSAGSSRASDRRAGVSLLPHD